jgi:hypothetical protein
MLRFYECNQNLWKAAIEPRIPALIEPFNAALENRGREQTYMKIYERVVSQGH